MASINPPVVNFSGGILGPLLHGRVDLPVYPAGAEEKSNWLPHAQGGMTRRPPLLFVDATNPTKKAFQIPFVFSVDQSYNIIATDEGFRFYIRDGIVTIPEVTATIANGSFSSSGSWTDESANPASMTITNGRMWLDSDGGSVAAGEQVITINETDTLHVLRFEVAFGPVNVRIGTSSGAHDLLNVEDLYAGVHLLEFTPPSSPVYLQFWHEANAGRAVDNVSILPGPEFVLPYPYSEDDLADLHWEQIGDVMYLCHGKHRQRRLERRGHRSWSLAKLLPTNGPFESLNTTRTTLTPSATTGEITLTASRDLFTQDDVDVLFMLTGPGQYQTATATTDDVYTGGVKVTGIGSNERTFRVSITGTWTGTVTLQRSSGNENNYTDFRTYTANRTEDINDNLDNETWFYRLAVKPGDYGTGTIVMEISYSGGSTTGICRVLQVNNATEAICEVLEPFGDTNPVRTWKRGSWSADQGYPVSVAAGYGRLWFGRGTRIWASASDDFTNFEEGTDDAQAFSRRLATPSSEGIRYLRFLNHLVIGTKTAEHIGVPNTASEPVGPTNFQTLASTYKGGSSIMPVEADGSVIFIDRTRKKVLQFTPNPKALSETAYITVDLNELSPDLMWDGIVDMGIQRLPEPRIFVVLASGIVRTLLFRRDVGDLGIAAWSTIRTPGGFIENVNVVPQNEEDAVYFIVRRTINGQTVRYIERLGSEVVLNDEDDFYLDSALSLELTRPQTVARPSGVTGTITITTDDPVWDGGDVDKIVWIGGGKVKVTAVDSSTQVTGDVLFDITTVDEDGNAAPIPGGRWGYGAEVSAVSGLDHLEGETVTIYADQSDAGTAVVSGGQVSLPKAASVVHIGLPFVSRWKSLKLAYGAQKGTALIQPKAVKNIGFVLYRTGPGISYGHSFENMKPLLTRFASGAWGAPVPLFTGEVFQGFDARYSSDTRIHLEVRGPAPARVLAYVPFIDERDR